MSIVQLSRFLSFFSSDSFNILPKHFRLSRTFLFFSVFCFPSRVSLDILPFLPSVCQHLFTTFSSLISGTISGVFTWYYPQFNFLDTKTTGYSQQPLNDIAKISNGEGGIWTLAPLLTTYSLSRGAPSANLGTSPKCPLFNIHDIPSIVQYFFLKYKKWDISVLFQKNTENISP